MQDNYILKIKAVGDIAPGDSSVDGFGVGSLSKKHGCDFLFQKLNGLLDEADILIGNLEGILSSRCYSETLRLGGIPELADTLRDLGFDIISLANNHVFDYGVDVLQETIKYCENAGLKICGLRSDSDDYYCEPVIIEKKTRKIGVLAYNWVGLEGMSEIGNYIATVSDGVVNYTWNRNRQKDKQAQQLIGDKNRDVLSDIKKLKKVVDIVVLLPHWGYEWTIYPPYGVVLEARQFIDAGVDCIIGTHPHVPQGIELYKEKMVAYSLGNFLFDTTLSKYSFGMILDCTIDNNNFCKYDFCFSRSDKLCQPARSNMKEDRENRELIIRSTESILADDAEQKLDDDLIYRKYEKAYNRMKLKKVRYLLQSMIKHPSMIKPVIQKCLNLLHLIMLRIKGEKIRW